MFWLICLYMLRKEHCPGDCFNIPMEKKKFLKEKHTEQTSNDVKLAIDRKKDLKLYLDVCSLHTHPWP